ncbi:MAG: helix-turn-helix transcriptional regulator [Nitrosotalea sp.]
MDTVFTERQIKILKSWLLNRKNKEIADELGTSESDVSQTIKDLKEKLNKLENSYGLLSEIGIIPKIGKLELTEKGREAFKTNQEKLEEKMKTESLNELDLSILSQVQKLTNPQQITIRGISDTYKKSDLIQQKCLPESRKLFTMVLSSVLNNPKTNLLISSDRAIVIPPAIESEKFKKLLITTKLKSKESTLMTPSLITFNFSVPLLHDKIIEEYSPIGDLIHSLRQESKSASDRPTSELKFHTDLIDLLIDRMISYILGTKRIEETAEIVEKLNQDTKKLHQLIEWLNSRGQTVQTRTR